MDGPFNDAMKKMFDTDTKGVCERTHTEFRRKDGQLWRYEYTRQYHTNGDYIDSNVSKTFVNASLV